MRKTLIALGVLLFSMNSMANDTKVQQAAKQESNIKDTTQMTTTGNPFAPIVEGKQYIVLPSLPSPSKEVIEFFSFNCPSCYRFEMEYHTPKLISKNLPKGTKFIQYHLSDFGPLSQELSEAWAIANVLNIQDKVASAIYRAIHEENSIHSDQDIKNLFARLDVNNETFEKTKNSFLTKAFLIQQNEALNEISPNSIPAIVVNRKFYVNPQGLDKTSVEDTITDYARTTAFLANLDPESKNAKATNESSPKVKNPKK